MSSRSFVSPRHKYCGNPRFQTGLPSGQEISREGGECTMIRLLAEVVSPKNALFQSVLTDWGYTDCGPFKPKFVSSTSPGPDLAIDATPQTRFVRGGPSPRTRNSLGISKDFGSQGLGVPVASRARTAALRQSSTPPRSPWGFVSPRHKSRGAPRS